MTRKVTLVRRIRRRKENKRQRRRVGRIVIVTRGEEIGDEEREREREREREGAISLRACVHEDTLHMHVHMPVSVNWGSFLWVPHNNGRSWFYIGALIFGNSHMAGVDARESTWSSAMPVHQNSGLWNPAAADGLLYEHLCSPLRIRTMPAQAAGMAERKPFTLLQMLGCSSVACGLLLHA